MEGGRVRTRHMNEPDDLCPLYTLSQVPLVLQTLGTSLDGEYFDSLGYPHGLSSRGKEKFSLSQISPLFVVV